jgi:FAD:protein FMN transferase
MPYLLTILFSLVVSAGELQRFEFSEIHMAAPVRVVLFAESAAHAESAKTACFSRVKALDDRLSNYRKSELRDLGKQTNSWVPVSEDLWTPLAAAHALMLASDGAFDVAVGPLAIQWRMAIFQHRLPRADAIAELRKRTGPNALAIDPARKAVRLGSGVELDLGGIAKGFVADSALATLTKAGIQYALVDAGGDIALSTPPPGRDWRVRVAGNGLLALTGGGIATSGDSERFVEIDGVRYSHIMDPRTGHGITNRCQVTVLAASGMMADALATAVSVLGPKAGIAHIETLAHTEALVVQLIRGEERHFRSSGFPKFTSPSKGTSNDPT